MSFTPIGDTLGKNAQSIDKQAEAGLAIEASEKIFADLFGDDKAVHAKPLFLKNRTLTVTCSSSVMAQEIRLNQKKIVDAINKELGKKEVDRIRYLV